jgi:hypothetical protein
MSDPEPLRASARPLEALLLDSAREDVPPPDLLARTLAKVGVAGAAVAVASVAASTASAGTSTASIVSAGTSTASGAATSAATSGAVAAAPVAVAAAPVAVAVAAGGGLLSAIGIGALAGLLTVGIAHQVLPPVAAPQEAPAVVVLSAPDDARGGGGQRVAPAPEPPPDPPRPALVPRALSAAVPSAPRVGRSAPLATELALIDEARGALASGDRARALASLDRYARQFPAGQLAHEASVIRAEATTDVDAGGSTP